MADVTFASAAASYAQTLGQARALAEAQQTQAQQNAAAQGADSFAQLVGDALVAARDIGQAAEESSVKAIKGQVSLHDVVAATSDAEVALQTVVAVRDRVITAYQEILRMPI